MFNRRQFVQFLSGLPFFGGFLAVNSCTSGPGLQRDLLGELGVRRLINAAGTYTSLTASLMPQEVIAAMLEASRHYVALDELHDKVGLRIAAMLKCEAAMVTAGAASALTLGTAAVLTGKDPEKIARLPDLNGMKTDVIIQKSHRFGYDHAVRNCGIRLIEVQTHQELESRVSESTALMLFLNANQDQGQIGAAEFVEIGRRHQIPTFNDCAADVPPVENLFKYVAMGFDLVTFSGGKGIRGPQSAGLLLGRRDLVEAARLNTSPHSDSIGRGMKVNKEEMVGMLVALELYLQRDHAREWLEWEERAQLIRNAAAAVPGVSAEIYVPAIANHVPHVRVSWDPNQLSLRPIQAEQALRSGEPSIEVKSDEQALRIGVWMMQPGEEGTVARRLGEVLRGA